MPTQVFNCVSGTFNGSAISKLRNAIVTWNDITAPKLSDNYHGPKYVDVVGHVLSGIIIVADIDVAQSYMAAASATLVITFNKGGSTGTATLKNVKFDRVIDIDFPFRGEDGLCTGVAIHFTSEWVSTADTIATMFVVA